MLKMALFDCAINEKCYSVVPTPGDLTAQEYPPPGNLPSKAKKMLMPRGQPRGGGWAQAELTDALITCHDENSSIHCYRYRCWRIR